MTANTLNTLNTQFTVHAERCEYAGRPLGLDTLRPRLSWQVRADRPGFRQSACQIQAARQMESLSEGQADLWDSGPVSSDQSVFVPYGGPELHSGERVWWRVRVWDEAGLSAWSRPAWWEMGLLHRTDWIGDWIGAALVGGPRTTVPCPYLRRTFQVEDRPILRARLYATALGMYEPWLNGTRVGDLALAPGWTDYDKRVYYQSYDVTESVQPGLNALGAVLGDGWYCGHIEMHGRQQYGDRPKFLAQMVIDYADGSQSVIGTDSHWKTMFGPILESDLLMGESFDARLDLGDWSAPEFDDARWPSVQTFPDTGAARAASPGPPIRPQETLPPVAPPVSVGGRWIYNLGQNMVGRIRLRVTGPAGTTLTLRYGERLDSDGGLYTANLRSARQTDYYTLRGGGQEEVWEPCFTFHGFQYVEVSGFPGEPPSTMIEGVVLHSDMTETGEFSCSDPQINQLQHNIQWGQKGNFLDVPTDCPQRDERLGWTGDAQVFIRTAAFNRDVSGFFAKWVQDLEDAQASSGAFPMFAPLTKSSGNAGDGGPAWADAGAICLWTLRLCYADQAILTRHYPALKRWIAQQEATSEAGIRIASGWQGFGDWLALDGGATWEGQTPKDLIGTAFFAHSAGLLAQIAALLGETDDAAAFQALSARVRDAFRARFLTLDGLLTTFTQTGAALALHFDLLPPESWPLTAQALVEDIHARGDHLATGFVGTPYLLSVLTEAGHLDVAYSLLRQTTWPSWLYSVTQGATTIWERWDGWTEDKGFQDTSMNSFNHYAYGAVGAWLYAAVAGIDLDPARPGGKHWRLHPRPGGGLTFARACLNSPYGPVRSEWRQEGARFLWTVEVPPNTTATATLPDGTVSEIGAGRHALSCDWDALSFKGQAPPQKP